jgi:hypothetical protein
MDLCRSHTCKEGEVFLYMSYPEHQSDLNRILESEMMGEILFNMAARLTWSSQRRRKWLLLRDLEAQTKNRLLEFLQLQQQRASLSRPVKIKGFYYGLILGLLPWSKSMKLLEHGATPFLKLYRHLEENADERSRELFTYVVAHEEAIVEFARLERAGDSEHSTRAVLDLLND